EHRAASELPPLSPRRPLHSLRLLLENPRWLMGFLCEGTAWGLYVVALALAPLALVQAVSAGGIGILAYLVTRATGCSLGKRELIGVAGASLGLALLGISLAGGAKPGSNGAWLSILLWIAASAVVAGALVRFGPRFVPAGAAFGIATGTVFAAGDVA